MILSFTYAGKDRSWSMIFFSELIYGFLNYLNDDVRMKMAI